MNPQRETSCPSNDDEEDAHSRGANGFKYPLDLGSTHTHTRTFVLPRHRELAASLRALFFLVPDTTPTACPPVALDLSPFSTSRPSSFFFRRKRFSQFQQRSNVRDKPANKRRYKRKVFKTFIFKQKLPRRATPRSSFPRYSFVSSPGTFDRLCRAKWNFYSRHVSSFRSNVNATLRLVE